MLSISNLCFPYLLLKNLKSTEIFLIYICQKYSTENMINTCEIFKNKLK